MDITEELLVKIGGWDVLKQAKGILATGRVLSSAWEPPLLKGVVQEGNNSMRAGLVMKSAVDVENLCPCRVSRSWGTICAHSVAVGLHHIRRLAPPEPVATKNAARATTSPKADEKPAAPAVKEGKRIQRSVGDGPGQPLQIHVILPPNYLPALQAGKVMLYFEGEFSGKRLPLNNVPQSTPFQVSEADERLLSASESLADGNAPGVLMLTLAQFAQLLPAVADHPRITIAKAKAVTVENTPAPLELVATLEANGEITLKLASMPKADTALPSATGLWILSGSTFTRVTLPSGYMGVLQAPIRLPRAKVPEFLSRDWPALTEHATVRANFKIEDFVLETQPPKFRLSLTGGLAHLQAQMEALYGTSSFIVGRKESAGAGFWLPDPKSPTRYSTRDLAAEQAAQGELMRAGFTGPHAEGLFQLAGQSSVLAFFARFYPRWQQRWEVHLEERLERSTKQNLERIEPKFEIRSSGERWFDLEVSYVGSTGERFSQADVQRLLLSGQSHAKLPNGKFAILDTGAVEDFQETLLDCAPEQREGLYRISNAQAGFLDAALQAQSWHFKSPQQWRERAAQLRGETKIEPPPLGPLETVLRPYQKQGVAWMQFLRSNNFGGILADEMGLGKTLQTLAFLQSLKARKLAHKPFLVVCPTSLVFNWVAEAKKFTPDLKSLAIQGSKRAPLFAEVPRHDLIVTSYALIRRDAEHYRALEFDTVILDEAHHIKNRQTQNAQAVKSIAAPHRLVLTGTPLENSVLDLWSIFDFLMPGYLGSATDFKERYEQPLNKERNPEVQARLAKRVRPFLLRRLKQEVAKDLPQKIEQISFCELTEEQQELYQAILEASRREVTEAVESQGFGKSKMLILNALLRLRQICCDLRLLKMEEAQKPKPSGKVEMFSELLEEVIDGGHRALVFSQFVGMLGILSERLKAENIPFCYLDGSTKDRGAVVEQFQKNNSIPLFLISLKAGGVGLNLTGADTVIHFDPWWNPAVEDQATDRAHRIGQTRVVTSYKLITRGTVEEKILSLQNKKREMIKATLGAEEDLANVCTWEEIQELFA